MSETRTDLASGKIMIREAEKRDIPAICEIMPSAFGRIGGGAWADPAYVAEGLASCAAKQSACERITVATVDGTVVGCSFVRRAISSDGKVVWREIGTRGGVAVAPEFHRIGVGAALVRSDENYLRDLGARVMLVEVRQQAWPFFLACGYRLAMPPIAVVTARSVYMHDRTVPSTMLMWLPLRGDIPVTDGPSRTRLVLDGPA